MLFGIFIKYENPVKLTVRTPLRLTKAVLDTTDNAYSSNNESILIFASKTEFAEDIAIGYLSCLNQDNTLNLLLTYDEEVIFKLDKPGGVWLSGYYEMDEVNYDDFEPALEAIQEKKPEGGDN